METIKKICPGCGGDQVSEKKRKCPMCGIPESSFIVMPVTEKAEKPLQYQNASPFARPPKKNEPDTNEIAKKTEINENLPETNDKQQEKSNTSSQEALKKETNKNYQNCVEQNKEPENRKTSSEKLTNIKKERVSPVEQKEHSVPGQNRKQTETKDIKNMQEPSEDPERKTEKKAPPERKIMSDKPGSEKVHAIPKKKTTPPKGESKSKKSEKEPAEKKAPIIKSDVREDVGIDFNEDHFYDDTPSLLPPEKDKIPISSILHALLWITIVGGFIFFLMNYILLF